MQRSCKRQCKSSGLGIRCVSLVGVVLLLFFCEQARWWSQEVDRTHEQAGATLLALQMRRQALKPRKVGKDEVHFDKVSTMQPASHACAQGSFRTTARGLHLVGSHSRLPPHALATWEPNAQAESLSPHHHRRPLVFGCPRPCSPSKTSRHTNKVFLA